MFNLHYRKVNINKIATTIRKGINIILLFSLILTSCKPVNTIQPQETVEPTPPPVQSTDVPQHTIEYEPTVFVQPEARIAENIDNSTIQGLSGINDSIENLLPSIPDLPEPPEMPEEFKAQIEEAKKAFDDAMHKLDSFVPPLNPVRNIVKTHQSKSEKKPIEVRTSIFNSTENTDILDAQFPKTENIDEQNLLANPRRNDEGGITFIVTTLADTDDGTCNSDCSLREALYASNDSAGMDTITFSISGTITISGDPLPQIFDIAGLTLDGEGQTVKINGGGFYSNSGSPFILKKLTIENGYIANYGPLTISDSTLNYTSPYCESELIVSNSDLNNSSSVSHGPVTISNVILKEGSFYTTSDLTIIDTKISYGAAHSAQSLTLQNSPITNGNAFSGSDSNISDSNFDNSWAYSGGKLSISDSLIERGSVFSQGIMEFANNIVNCTSVYCYIQSNEDLKITKSYFSAYEKGAIVCLKDLIIENTIFDFLIEGIIYSAGMLTMNDSSFTATGYSYIVSGDIANITNTPVTNTNDGITIQSEKALTYSGATFVTTKSGSIYSQDALTIQDSVVTLGQYGSAQGVSGLTIANSTITNGVVVGNETSSYSNSNFINNYLLNSSTLAISGTNSYKNVSFSGAQRAKVEIGKGSTINISNSSISDCVNIVNKGILSSTNNTFVSCPINNNSRLDLYNTILAGSTCTGNNATGQNNLLETSGANSCGLQDKVNGNIIEHSAYLGLPKGNPSYFPLSPSSSAINAGDDAICASDPVNNASINGIARPQDGHCDIGAYEAGPAQIVNDDETISDCVMVIVR